MVLTTESPPHASTHTQLGEVAGWPSPDDEVCPPPSPPRALGEVVGLIHEAEPCPHAPTHPPLPHACVIGHALCKCVIGHPPPPHTPTPAMQWGGGCGLSHEAEPCSGVVAVA